MLYEDLCFDAQQAVEKAVRAVFVSRRLVFPYVHDLTLLITLLEREGVQIPEEVRSAESLTRFAAAARYPGITESVEVEEYRDALALAENAVRWAAGLIS